MFPQSLHLKWWNAKIKISFKKACEFSMFLTCRIPHFIYHVALYFSSISPFSANLLSGGGSSWFIRCCFPPLIIFCLFASIFSSRSLRNRAKAPSEALWELQHESETGALLGGEGDGSSGDDPLSACQLGKYKYTHTTCTYMQTHPYEFWVL